MPAADVIYQSMSCILIVVICISENIRQLIFVITCFVFSLFLHFVSICLHESPFVTYVASRKVSR